MAVFENFPYTDVHQLNLDWIIKIVKKLDAHFDQLTVDVQETLANFKTELAEQEAKIDNKLEDLDAQLQEWFESKEPEIAVLVNAYIENNLGNFIAHATYLASSETLKIGDGEQGEILTPTVSITNDIVADTSVDYSEFQTKNGFVIARLMTEAKIWSNNDILYNIPEAYNVISGRNNLYFIGTLSNTEYSNVQLIFDKTNRRIKINNLPASYLSGPTSVRIYAWFIYPYL